MSEVFAFDPFTDAAVLQRLGVQQAVVTTATLEGHFIARNAGGLTIGLGRDDQARVDGMVLHLSPEAHARFALVNAVFGAMPVEVDLGGADAPRRVVAYRREPDGDCARGAPEGDCARGAPEGEARSLLIEVIREILDEADARDPGRRTPAAIAARLASIGYRALARARGRASVEAPRGPGADFGLADVVAEEVQRPYSDFFAVEAHRIRHRRFDGSMTDMLERAVFASGDAVTVLPFDPRRGSVLLIEQFRAGAMARSDPRPWFLEAIAGRCDPGETLETSARREALEEAGLTLGRLERVAAYYTTPGLSAEHVTAFVGEADLAAAGGTHGLDVEQEDIRALVVPINEALGYAQSGVVRNAPLLILLLWLAQHHLRLTADWAGETAPLDARVRSG